MSKFYNHVMSESKIISEILQKNRDMNGMTEKEMTDYDAATVCTACGEPFTDTNWKVCHHCHVSGNYLYPACNNCNLQPKTTSRKRKANGKNKRRKKTKKSNKDDEVDYDSAEEDYIDNFFSADSLPQPKVLRRTFCNQTFQETVHPATERRRRQTTHIW